MHCDDTGIRVHQDEFINQYGMKIACTKWKRADDKHRAVLFLSHGFGDHCQGFDPFLRPFVNDGFLVVSHDHVGHGRSEGERAQISSFHDYATDIFTHLDAVSKDYPHLPIFIFGHSMGGTIAVLCALERPSFFAGMVISGAAIQRKMTSWIPVFLGRLVAYMFPSYEVMAFNNDLVSRNLDVIKKYKDDPLTWKGGIKCQWGVAFEDASAEMNANLHRISCPLLAMHGSLDAYTKPDGSRKLVALAASKDKTLKIYDGFYHKITSEPGADGELVRQDIYRWLHDRIQPSGNDSRL